LLPNIVAVEREFEIVGGVPDRLAGAVPPQMTRQRRNVQQAGHNAHCSDWTRRGGSRRTIASTRQFAQCCAALAFRTYCPTQTENKTNLAAGETVQEPGLGLIYYITQIQFDFGAVALARVRMRATWVSAGR
jgi:hypothetical protein